MKRAATPASLALLLMVLGSGCRGGPSSPPSTPGPLLGTPIEVVDEEGDASEPDLTPRERWGAPFAVTSAGRITPTEPRSVIVLSADPAIAAGLEVQQEIEASLPRRVAPGQPVSAGATERAEDAGARPGGSDGRAEVPQRPPAGSVPPARQD